MEPDDRGMEIEDAKVRGDMESMGNQGHQDILVLGRRSITILCVVRILVSMVSRYSELSSCQAVGGPGGVGELRVALTMTVSTLGWRIVPA